MKTRRDLKRERRPQAHSCWDHIICAPLWPLHGVNLGTLRRTCEAVGACLAVPHYPWVPEAINRGYTIDQRSCVHWARPDALAWLAREAAREDTDVIAVELAEGATRLADVKPVDPRRRCVMLLGHEQSGIPDDALEFIQGCVEIPMVGSGTTLNVAVAGSLVLYRLAGLL